MSHSDLSPAALRRLPTMPALALVAALAAGIALPASVRAQAAARPAAAAPQASPAPAAPGPAAAGPAGNAAALPPTLPEIRLPDMRDIKLPVARQVRAAQNLMGMGRQRLALVVALGTVGRRTVVDNAARDAQAVAAALRDGGFVVMLREDLTAQDLRASLKDFREKLQPGGVGFVFVSGLGAQVDGANLLITRDAPLDATLPPPELARRLKSGAVPLEEVSDALIGTPDSPRLLVVDAAWQHPALATLPQPGLAQPRLPFGVMALFGHALGGVQEVPIVAPLSLPPPTKAAEIAATPFVRTLVGALTRPRITGPEALRSVRRAVVDTSLGQRSPWVGGDTEDKEELAEASLLDGLVPRTPEEIAREALLRGASRLTQRAAGEKSVTQILQPGGAPGSVPAAPDVSRMLPDVPGSSLASSVGSVGSAVGTAASVATTVAGVAGAAAAVQSVQAAAATTSVVSATLGAATGGAGVVGRTAMALAARTVGSSGTPSGTAATAATAAKAATPAVTAAAPAAAAAAPAAVTAPAAIAAPAAAATPLAAAAPTVAAAAAPAAVVAPLTPAASVTAFTPPAAAAGTAVPAAADTAAAAAATPAAAAPAAGAAVPAATGTAAASPAAAAAAPVAASPLTATPEPGEAAATAATGDPAGRAAKAGASTAADTASASTAPPDARGARGNGPGNKGEPAIPAAPRVNPFGFTEGDTFTFQQLDTWGGQVVGEYTVHIEEVMGNGGLRANGQQTQMDPQGRPISQARPDGSFSRFEPYQDLWWANPKGGERRVVQFVEKFRRADDMRGQTEWRGGSVVARATEIEIPAGKFDVLPIETTGSWFETLANGERSSGRWSRTVYYSPKLKHPVAIDMRDLDATGRLLRSERIELMRAQSARGTP